MAPIPNVQINMNEEIHTWNSKMVGAFLRKNAMMEYCIKFEKTNIDGEILLKLKFNDFLKLGMKDIEASLIFQALENYKKERKKFIL